MDAGAAFVAKSIESHLGVRPEHVTAVSTRPGVEVFEASLGNRAVLFKADREAGRGRVVLEAWAYQRVRELGAPVPLVLATDLGRETYPRNFIIVEKVRGVPLSKLEATAEDREKLIRGAGWAIRAVHEIGVPGFGPLDEEVYLRSAQVQGEHDSWRGFLDELLGVAVQSLQSEGTIGDALAERIDQVVADHAEYLELGPVGHLLHGRFDPAHVLVSEGSITGVVGFDDRSSGDPAWDLAGFLVDNPAEARSLMAGYDADKHRAAAFEMAVPLYGGLRALLDARRSHDEGRADDRDRLLAVADSSFRALGVP